MGEILADRHAPPVASILASEPSAVYAAQGLQLNELVTQLKVSDSAELTALKQALATRAAPQEAKAWEPKLLTALLGAHVRFAKAYGLARQLDELTHEEPLPPNRFAQNDIKEMLALLEARMVNTPEVELVVASREQAKITALRLHKLEKLGR